MIKRIQQFVTEDIWRVNPADLPKWRAFVIKQIRIIALSVRGFNEDKLLLRASALTFYSMLSIVPVLAMLFAVAKGFGYERTLQENIMSSISQHQEVWMQAFDYANKTLENTKGGLVGGIGVVLLIYSVLQVLGHIEQSMNEIWHLNKPRSWMRKFSDYFSMMLIGPVLLVLSGSVMVFIQTQITSITEQIALIGFFAPLIHFMLKLLPYTLIWFALTLVYIIMPNTKVEFKSAFVAGVIAGTLFVISEWVYVYFQVGVAKYNAIYGSFAAVPLFLIWLQTAWIIVLLGSEIAYAYQNVKRYEYEHDAQQLSTIKKKKFTVAILNLVLKRFINEEEPLSNAELAEQLGLPVRVVRIITNQLVDCALLAPLAEEDASKETTFIPAKPMAHYTFTQIFNDLENAGSHLITLQNTQEAIEVENAFKQYDKQLLQSGIQLPLQPK